MAHPGTGWKSKSHKFLEGHESHPGMRILLGFAKTTLKTRAQRNAIFKLKKINKMFKARILCAINVIQM